MKTKLLIGIYCCYLFLILSAMTCDEYTPTSTQVDLSGLELFSLDSSGKLPVTIANGRCPKEAYMLRIAPTYNADDADYDNYELNVPITAVRIFTLTDFSAEHSVGSDVSSLFRTVYRALNYVFPVTSLHREYNFSLVLMTYPHPGNYQFRVELELEDGTVFSEETEMLEFY